MTLVDNQHSTRSTQLAAPNSQHPMGHDQRPRRDWPSFHHRSYSKSREDRIRVALSTPGKGSGVLPTHAQVSPLTTVPQVLNLELKQTLKTTVPTCSRQQTSGQDLSALGVSRAPSSTGTGGAKLKMLRRGSGSKPPRFRPGRLHHQPWFPGSNPVAGRGRRVCSLHYHDLNASPQTLRATIGSIPNAMPDRVKSATIVKVSQRPEASHRSKVQRTR